MRDYNPSITKVPKSIIQVSKELSRQNFCDIQTSGHRYLRLIRNR